MNFDCTSDGDPNHTQLLSFLSVSEEGCEKGFLRYNENICIAQK